MTIRAEIVDSKAYAALSSTVDTLQNNAAYKNIFADPAIAHAADVEAALVWHEHELIAAFPFRFFYSHIATLLHEYAVLTVPLIHKDYLEVGWQCLLDAFAQTGATTLHCPYIPDGELSAALRRVLQQRNQAFKVLAQEKRGFVFAQATEPFFSARISSKARRTMKKQRRELQELGEVSYRVFLGEEAMAVLSVFLGLEKAGWKGRRGTAIASDAKDEAFVTKFLHSLGYHKFFISALMRGETPLAMGLVLKSGGFWWFWKMAYDENASKQSPGIHYAHALVEQMLKDPEFREADSCAALRLERHVALFDAPRSFSNILIATQPGKRFAFAWLATRMKAKIMLKMFAKASLKKISR